MEKVFIALPQLSYLAGFSSLFISGEQFRGFSMVPFVFVAYQYCNITTYLHKVLITIDAVVGLYTQANTAFYAGTFTLPMNS